jgi:hypothetical protein
VNPRPKFGPGARRVPFVGWQFIAFRIGLWFPAAWRTTARRRRFLFLGLSAPGFFTISALPLHENLWALLSGLAAMGLAYAFRRLSEPLFLATTGDGYVRVQDPQA